MIPVQKVETLIEMTEGSQWKVPFEYSHPELGRAEFTVCVRWSRGRIREMWLYPRQQKRYEQGWHFPRLSSDSLGIGSWNHKGLDDPKVWRMWWCKEHRCMATEFYVPNYSNELDIIAGSTLSIHCGIRGKS